MLIPLCKPTRNTSNTIKKKEGKHKTKQENYTKTHLQNQKNPYKKEEQLYNEKMGP